MVTIGQRLEETTNIPDIPSAKAQPSTRAKSDPSPYVQVIIYDYTVGRGYIDGVPFDELQAHLPDSCRRTPDLSDILLKFVFVGAACGFIYLYLMLNVGVLYLQPGIKFMAFLKSQMLVLPGALLCGGGVGALIGNTLTPILGPKQFYLVKRYFQEWLDTDTGEVIQKVVIEPKLAQESAGIPIGGEEGELLGIFDAASLSNDLKAQPFRKLFLLSFSDTARKLELAALAVIAIGLIVAIFMLVSQ